MKSFIFSVLFAFAAHASAADLVYPLTSISKASGTNIVSGTLTIKANTIELDLQGSLICTAPDADGSVDCFPSEELRVELPIVEKNLTGCGDFYKAELDERPVDGPHYVLAVNDYTQAQCMKYFPDAVTATLDITLQNWFTGEMGTETYQMTFGHAQTKTLP